MQKRLTLLFILSVAASSCLASQFDLQSPRTGKSYGPFDARFGAKVEIDKSSFTIIRPASYKSKTGSGKLAFAVHQNFLLGSTTTGRLYGPFSFKYGTKVKIGKKSFFIVKASGPKPTTKKKSFPAARSTGAVRSRTKYSILHRWQPNNELDGFGADILVRKGLAENKLVNFVKTLGRRYDPVNIRVFTSTAACKQERSLSFGPEHDSGYILDYMKNTTGRGLFNGIHEIRWMQQVGKFSRRFGTRTEL